MKTNDYVSKYFFVVEPNIDGFLYDFNLNFLEEIEKRKDKNGNIEMQPFHAAAKCMKDKFDSINKKLESYQKNQISEKVWNKFWGKYVCPLRERLFPGKMDNIRKQKEEEKKREKRLHDYYNHFGDFDYDFFKKMMNNFFGKIFSFSSEKYFNVLGLNNDASIDEIKQAFRRKSMLCHPDKNGNAEEFIKLKEAKDICLKIRERE